MTFIWPLMLFSLLVLPLLGVLYVGALRRRRRMSASFGSLGLVREAAGKRYGRRRHVPPAIFLIGLAVLGVALARPQAVVSLPRVEGIVILAFDVSGSMGADDLKPTRMEAAKVAAKGFVERQPPTVRIGVVAFSDNGLSVQVPTNDQAEVLAAINRLAPSRGTSLANGILASLNAITLAETGEPPRFYTNQTAVVAPTPTPVPKGSHTTATIILLTDGENTGPPDPAAATKLAADRGVRIHTVGIGSAAGSTLQIEGFSVFTQLDEQGLKQIAQLTDGTYSNATDAASLQKIYDSLDSRLVVRPQKMEVTSLFSGAGLLILLIGGAFSLLWFGRVP
ncbi:MAG: VWA domain-containing protein [Thermomicrobiales bacterium]